MKRRFLLVFKFIPSFILLFVAVGYAEVIYIGGGAYPVKNALEPIKLAFEERAGMKLIVIPSRPGNASTSLENGVVEAPADTLNYYYWVDLLRRNNIEVKNPERFKKYHLGKERILVLLNKENPVNKLPKEQIKGIIIGKICNSKKVRGEGFSHFHG